jgi:hypothetical protein
VQLHEGIIDIQSEVGKGTTFIIRLPQKNWLIYSAAIRPEGDIRGPKPIPGMGNDFDIGGMLFRYPSTENGYRGL